MWERVSQRRRGSATSGKYVLEGLDMLTVAGARGGEQRQALGGRCRIGERVAGVARLCGRGLGDTATEVAGVESAWRASRRRFDGAAGKWPLGM